jgi:hypothetical protein
MLHYDESYSTLLFATRAMSVRTSVVMNQKVEYKNYDENGTPISPMIDRYGGAASHNEIKLKE